MAYDFSDRCGDTARELRDAMDAIRAAALTLDKLIDKAEAAEWPSPIKGYDWDELNAADLSAISPAAYAEQHCEAVAAREEAGINA